jgi:hypothetical protein
MSASGGIRIIHGNGDGTLVDLNKDGILDLAVANTGSDTISVHLGQCK